MEEITVRKIMEIHDKIVDETGGDRRLLSEATLYQIVLQINMRPEPVVRVAQILFSFCTYPVFKEKNTETAVVLAKDVLAAEGYHISEKSMDMTALTDAILGYGAETEDIEDWIYKNIINTGSS